MNTYRIERVNGQFEVVVYERRWFRERRKLIRRLERLSQAEEVFVRAIDEAFAKRLDERRFAPSKLRLRTVSRARMKNTSTPRSFCSTVGHPSPTR
jgi:hypothetical protein